MKIQKNDAILKMWGNFDAKTGIYPDIYRTRHMTLENTMKLEEQTQLETMLDCLSTGIIILEATYLRVRYINSYARTQLAEQWHSQSLIGRDIEELLTRDAYRIVLPILQQVAASKQEKFYQEVPYEGISETKGRTYWRITIKPLQTSLLADASSGDAICITVEDVTQAVRARLHSNAIHTISKTIAGAHTLPRVLDSILDAVHILVGTTHCAILLIDHSPANSDATVPAQHSVTVAAQKGLHLSSQEWHPLMGHRLLLGRVEQGQHTLTIMDTNAMPELDLPLLDSDGTPLRPVAILCIPIFGPTHSSIPTSAHEEVPTQEVIGSIEVYYDHPHRFPVEEIELLEQIAQQAGLAIQNARLFRDIDQFARAERRSAHQQAYMMQAIPDGVIIVDPRWRIAETNNAIRTLLGWPQESHELTGLPLNEAFRQSKATLPPFLTGTMSIKDFEQRASTGHIDEFKLLSANGRTIRCTYTPVCDNLGDTFAFIVTFHDVTEQVVARERIEAEVIARTQELAQRNEALYQAQLAQETEHARLELLIEHLPSGVLLVSAHDGSIITVNNYAVQLLRHMGVPMTSITDAKQLIGNDAGELLGHVPLYDLSGSSVPYMEQPLARALYIGEATESELHTLDTDDQPLHILANAAPLRTSQGTITSAILVLQDITALKTLERTREDFFTTMAHELKTPLANVRAHLSALLMHDVEWSAEEQQELIQGADEQVQRLIEMINHVLNASRVEVGALRPTFEPILVPELLEDLQERLAALISSSRRDLKIMMEARLPAIEADYELIMSVLTNLLSNAFRYTPTGEAVTLEATITHDEETMQPVGVTLSVRDKGPGISPEQQKHLFNRFSTLTAQSHSEQPSSTLGNARWSSPSGLGLYISRGIVEAHHSSLKLTSSPGQGACFSFTLPIADSHQFIRQMSAVTVPEMFTDR